MECAMCSKEAIQTYEDEPSCGRISCELRIQEGLDYARNHADGDDYI